MKYVKKFEGWRENLAVGLSLAGSVAMGQNKSQDDRQKPATEQSTKETTDQKIDRLSKESGYGFGSSTDLSTAKKQALFKAKSNLTEKGKFKGSVVIQDECITQNSSGGYDYHVVIKS